MSGYYFPLFQQRATTSNALKREIEHLETLLHNCQQRRLQAVDFMATLFARLRGSDVKVKRQRGSTTDKAKMNAAIRTVLDADGNKDLREYFKDATAPTTVLGSMADSFLQSTSKGPNNTRASSRLLQFSLSLVASSPAAYHRLQQACPALPSVSTVTKYKYVRLSSWHC